MFKLSTEALQGASLTELRLHSVNYGSRLKPSLDFLRENNATHGFHAVREVKEPRSTNEVILRHRAAFKSLRPTKRRHRNAAAKGHDQNDNAVTEK